MNTPKRSTLVHELKKLARSRADEIGITLEVTQDNQRTVAIVMAMFVEDRLRGAMERRMNHLTKDELRDIFEERGALSDFGSKIQVGYALNLFGPKSKSDLGLIREIRNAFAHGFQQIDFMTKQVADVCSALHCFNLVEEVVLNKLRFEHPTDGTQQVRPVDKYVYSCAVLTSIIGDASKIV